MSNPSKSAITEVESLANSAFSSCVISESGLLNLKSCDKSLTGSFGGGSGVSPIDSSLITTLVTIKFSSLSLLNKSL